VSSRNGTISECFSSLVNPEEYFDEMNVMIHGIDEEDVEAEREGFEPNSPICSISIIYENSFR
jgi:DNA polymerase III epsilon subunit-like protein